MKMGTNQMLFFRFNFTIAISKSAEASKQVIAGR